MNYRAFCVLVNTFDVLKDCAFVVEDDIYVLKLVAQCAVLSCYLLSGLAIVRLELFFVSKL